MVMESTVRVPGDDGVRYDIQTLRQQMHSRFDEMEKRFDERFDEMEKREEAAHAAIGQRIDKVEAKLGQLEAKLDLLIEQSIGGSPGTTVAKDLV